MIQTIDITDRFLAKIQSNNDALDTIDVKKILIIYDPNLFFIGDCLAALRQVRVVKDYFKEARISVQSKYSQMLDVIRNHPLIEESYIRPSSETDIAKYDLILYGAEDETEILKAVDRIENIDEINTCLFGISDNTTLVKCRIFGKVPFQLTRDDLSTSPRANEIYLADDERAAAIKYLADHGVKEGENIVVLLDSSTKQVKMMNTLQYFKFVQMLGTLSNTRFVVFDKDNAGKQKFYKSFLRNDSLFERFIFLSGERLRDSIALLSHPQVKMIFGPCTGLLHCASGIYQTLSQTRSNSFQQTPIMIAYCGRYDTGIIENEYSWWGGTLVDCIKLVAQDGRKEISFVTAEDANTERFMSNLLYCAEYKSDDLFNFILSNYEERLKDLGLTPKK